MKRVLLLSVVASFSALIFFLLLHYRYGSIIDVGSVKITKTGVTIEKVHYTEVKDGTVEWTLDADSANYVQADGVTIFTNPKVLFYGKDGSVYTMTGSEGSYMKESGNIKVSGDVLVVTGDGYTLATQSLRYDTASKEITTEERVSIDTSEMRIEGVGLLISVDRESFSVLDDVRTELRYALM
ncbi:MAG: LPS export ABC transporter periplasmic protein LptC [Thermodesulfobacteriota bacterium]